MNLHKFHAQLWCVYKFIKEFEDSPSLEPGTVRMPSERANHWANGSLRWKLIEKHCIWIKDYLPTLYAIAAAVAAAAGAGAAVVVYYVIA